MRVIGVIAALVIACPSPARADDQAIADARAALDKSDYLGARDALTRALASGDNGRDALVEIHRMTGIVAGALGETAAAEASFERMLSLAPKAELPAGTSPKITKPFAAAKARAKKAKPLEIKATTAAGPPAVTVTIASDPRQMIERVRAVARVDGGREETNEQPADAKVVIELRAGARIDVWVVALDAHGNRLAEIGSSEVPLVIVGEDAKPPPGDGAEPRPTPVPPTPEGPRKPRPLIAKWWLWGGVAVVFGGAAGYFAYDARKAVDELDRLNADSSNHSFTEAKDVESRARRDVLFANIGFAVAGAAAITATILFLTDPGPARPERRTAVTPVPLADGGAVVLEVPF
jgi:hypothetical protein